MEIFFSILKFTELKTQSIPFSNQEGLFVFLVCNYFHFFSYGDFEILLLDRFIVLKYLVGKILCCSFIIHFS